MIILNFIVLCICRSYVNKFMLVSLFGFLVSHNVLGRLGNFALLTSENVCIVQAQKEEEKSCHFNIVVVL